MANILDYLRWRSDLTLWQYPLCEVDNLVLSQLANLRWEKMLQTDEQPTLGDLWPRIEGQILFRASPRTTTDSYFPHVAK